MHTPALQILFRCYYCFYYMAIRSFPGNSACCLAVGLRQQYTALLCAFLVKYNICMLSHNIYCWVLLAFSLPSMEICCSEWQQSCLKVLSCCRKLLGQSKTPHLKESNYSEWNLLHSLSDTKKTPAFVIALCWNHGEILKGRYLIKP